MANKANRGMLWGSEEIEALLEIWADTHIQMLFANTHKNTKVFKVFSSRLKERGFNITSEQCRAKFKKLPCSYIKTRDILRRSGESPEIKLKCPYYDQLDIILGTRPCSNPQNIVESFIEDESSSSMEANLEEDIPAQCNPLFTLGTFTKYAQRFSEETSSNCFSFTVPSFQVYR
ncbi:UNVERIFIED_CONTAM: hypothetical protein FKN15_064322 [Acipenser sinensis]